MGHLPIRSLTIAIIAGMLVAAIVHAGEPLRIDEGVTVTMEYTIRLPDDTLYYSNVGKTPLSFTQGSHRVIPGLEKAIAGMQARETKTAIIPTEDAYGPYSPMKQISVKREHAPPDVTVGKILVSPDGKERATVLEVRDTSVLLDFNHPLAGKDLIFEITILHVEAPQM